MSVSCLLLSTLKKVMRTLPFAYMCVCVQGNSESCGRILTIFAGLIEPSRKRLDLHAHGPKQKG